MWYTVKSACFVVRYTDGLFVDKDISSAVLSTALTGCVFITAEALVKRSNQFNCYNLRRRPLSQYVFPVALIFLRSVDFKAR